MEYKIRLSHLNPWNMRLFSLSLSLSIIFLIMSFCPSVGATNNFNGNENTLVLFACEKCKFRWSFKLLPYILSLQSFFWLWLWIFFSLISLQWHNSQLRSSIYLQFYTRGWQLNQVSIYLSLLFRLFSLYYYVVLYCLVLTLPWIQSFIR